MKESEELADNIRDLKKAKAIATAHVAKRKRQKPAG
jgi:hypothetical protein